MPARSIKVWNSTTSEWEDVAVASPDTSSFVQNSLFANKGTIAAASAANTPAALSVGANDTVLTADSSTATGLAWKAATGGKILQVVRATDTTQRTTTSTSLVDVTGMSVTITPQKNTSTILLIVAANVEAASSTNYANFAITDNSNSAVSGSESHFVGVATTQTPATFIAWATPATTSSTTYKFRFRTDNAATTAKVRNDQATGQMFAIEVGA